VVIGFYWVLLVYLDFIGVFQIFCLIICIFLLIFGLFKYLIAHNSKNLINKSVRLNQLWLPVKNL
jgi:hypothetical protein